MPEPEFPDIVVKLTGEDGNVFAIIGRVSQALRRGDVTPAAIQSYRDKCCEASSYDEVLQITMRTVTVE